MSDKPYKCLVCGDWIKAGWTHACLNRSYRSLDDLPPIPPERRLIFSRELSSYIESPLADAAERGSYPSLAVAGQPVEGSAASSSERPKLTIIRGGKDTPLLIEKITENK